MSIQGKKLLGLILGLWHNMTCFICFITLVLYDKFGVENESDTTPNT